MGDGFTAADQPTYNQWVDDTLIKGVFGHDYYSEDASAYNIYRVNLESVDSGVSARTYDEKGTVDPSDDTIASQTIRNTALGIIRKDHRPTVAGEGGGARGGPRRHALSTQFEREVRPVAELVDLPQSALPDAIEARGARTPKV